MESSFLNLLDLQAFVCGFCYYSYMAMRIFLSLCFVGLLLGAVDARADIFVRQHEKQPESTREESKRSWTGIFLRPFQRDKNQEANKSIVRRSSHLGLDYTRRINQLKAQQAELAESFRRFNYWAQSGRKPSNATEVLSYADAHRAPARLAMLEARSQRMARIEARRRQQREQYRASVLANAPNPDAVIAFNIAQLEAKRAGQNSVVRIPEVGRTQPASQQRVRQIYLPPSQDGPVRVFRDTR